MSSYDSFNRRWERDRKRRAREAAKNYKAQLKQQLIENAAQAVKQYKEYVDLLLSMHKECEEPVDWNDIRTAPQPAEPIFKSTNADKAQIALTGYKPGFLDKIFFRTEKKVKNLENLLALAKEQDKKDYEDSLKKHAQAVKDNKKLKEILAGMDRKEAKSFINALNFFDAFSDFGELGSQLSFEFKGSLFDVELNINGADIVPDYELSQTSTGKLSKKAMAKGKFYELYQDHVCSSVLRVARDVFSYLPLEHVRITAMSELLNAKTGHMENVPVLSVIVSRNTVDALNLQTIDPSTSMSNFVHTMNFKKTTGFTGVAKAELN